jgi:transcriptional regulator GlxA family with amidase domain
MLVRREVSHVGFKNLQTWIGKNLRKPITVTELARRSGMSPRHFARRFAQALQMTPALFVEHLRVDAARRLLEDTRATVNDIARSCGFGSADTMRRSFLRILGVAPKDYHTHFRNWRLGGSPVFEN